MSFAGWRHFIAARGSDCGYLRAVLSLEQGLTMLSNMKNVLRFWARMWSSDRCHSLYKTAVLVLLLVSHLAVCSCWFPLNTELEVLSSKVNFHNDHMLLQINWLKWAKPLKDANLSWLVLTNRLTCLRVELTTVCCGLEYIVGLCLVSRSIKVTSTLPLF